MNYNRGSSGSVIKAIAIIYMVIGLISSAVVAGQLADSLSHGKGGFLYFLVLSSFVFLVALVFYGFGELIGNTAETNGLLQAQADELRALKKMLSDRPVVAAPETAGRAKIEQKQSSGAILQDPEANRPSEPVFKEVAPLPVSDKMFFSSLLGLDSAKAMLDRINEQYPSTKNPDIQHLIEDLQSSAGFERIYGKATTDARKKLQAFLEKLQ